MIRVKLLPAVLALLLLTGCWDKLELEEQAYTVVLGIDQAEDREMIKVTFQIANPQVGSSDTGSAENEPPSDIVTFTAPDVLSAKELANSVVTRKISFAHLRSLVVSEEFAKNKYFHRIITASMRDPEMRREVNLIVSKENASEFIHKNNPKMETRPHKYYAFMQERWSDTGHVPFSTLNRYFTRISQHSLFMGIYATTERSEKKPQKDEDRYLAGDIPQSAGDPTQIMGSAVFKNGIMIGKLTGEETRQMLFLRRKSLVQSLITTFPDPTNDRYRVTVRLIKKGNTKVKVNVRQEPASVHVTVPLKVQVLSTPSFANYAEDKGLQKLLTQAIAKNLEEGAERLVNKTQNKLKGDPFLWSLNARTQFWTRTEFERYDWDEQYVKADVSIHYDLLLESFGKQLKPLTPDRGIGSE